MYERWGLGLADLHYAYQGQRAPMDPLLAAFFTEILDRAQKSLQKHPIEGIPPSLMVERLRPKLQQEQQRLSTYGYMHGDCHAGNFLFNPETDAFWAVDLSKVALSIDANQEPIGVPFYDYAQIMNGLIQWPRFGLSEAELLQLQNAFDKGYQAGQGLIPDADTLSFYQQLDNLSWLTFYHEHENEFSPPIKKIMDELFIARRDWMKAKSDER